MSGAAAGQSKNYDGQTDRETLMSTVCGLADTGDIIKVT